MMTKSQITLGILNLAVSTNDIWWKVNPTPSHKSRPFLIFLKK